MTTQNSIFDIPGILESDPKLSFFGELNRRTGLSPNQRQFFEGQFDEIFNRFTGMIGGRLQDVPEGAEFDPSTLPSFDDFVGDFKFKQNFLSRPPSLRPGGGTARFAPPTRFLL